MSDSIHHEHEWFRRHLPDHLLDLLVEGEQKRFDSHARRCATCARLLARALGARPDWWDDAGHAPVAVLLEWDPAARGEPTHEAVRAHLAHCEDCRRDLEELRGAGVAGQVEPAPTVSSRPSPAAAHRAPAWRGLVAAGGTAAAVVAAVLLWPRPTLHAPAPPASSPVTPLTGAPSAGPAPDAPRNPVPEPGRTAEPVALATSDRGAAAAMTEIRIAPGVTIVPLTLPALPIADEAMLVAELRDHAGALVHRQVLVARRALMRGGVELPAEDLGEGRYTLTVRYVDPALGESLREFTLDVRISR